MTTVSVILSTRNAAKTISACLKSCLDQNVPPNEIIVVDRDSTDRTKEIAGEFTQKVFNIGPERSAQRNFGAKKATGEYVFFIDADMELSREVISEAIETVKNDKFQALTIPEVSFGKGFWAQVKSFERSFYLGEESLEAPRFIRKKEFELVGGYDEGMVAGEDWDLANRLRSRGVNIGRIRSNIFHNEGQLSIITTAKKKFYYGTKIASYLAKGNAKTNQLVPLRPVFFKHPIKLLQSPHLSAGLIILKLVEFGAGGLGFAKSLISRQR